MNSLDDSEQRDCNWIRRTLYRVSTDNQNFDRQREELWIYTVDNFGVEPSTTEVLERAELYRDYDPSNASAFPELAIGD